MKKNNYQEASFWEARYKQNICQWFQWLATPNQLSPLLQKYLKEGSKILQLGCGSSNLADKMMTLHHQSVTCLDFSKEVVRHKSKHAKDGITYKVHDITQVLPFEDESFDALVEKDTLDCLFCFEDYPGRVMRVMKQCYRVLKEGGVMLSISHGKEKMRRFFYRTRFSPFNVKVVPIDELKNGQTMVYMYVLTKGDVEVDPNEEPFVEADEVEGEEGPRDEGNEVIEEAQNEDQKGVVEQQPQKQEVQAEEQPEQAGVQQAESPAKEEQRPDQQQEEYQFDELDAEQS